MDWARINNSKWYSSSKCSIFNMPIYKRMGSSPTLAIPCLILRLMETKWAFKATSLTTATNQLLAKTLRRHIITSAQQHHTLPLKTIGRLIRPPSIKCKRHLPRILPRIKTRVNHTTQSTARPPLAKLGSQPLSRRVAQSITIRKA